MQRTLSTLGPHTLLAASLSLLADVALAQADGVAEATSACPRADSVWSVATPNARMPGVCRRFEFGQADELSASSQTGAFPGTSAAWSRSDAPDCRGWFTGAPVATLTASGSTPLFVYAVSALREIHTGAGVDSEFFPDRAIGSRALIRVRRPDGSTTCGRAGLDLRDRATGNAPAGRYEVSIGTPMAEVGPDGRAVPWSFQTTWLGISALPGMYLGGYVHGYAPWAFADRFADERGEADRSRVVTDQALRGATGSCARYTHRSSRSVRMTVPSDRYLEVVLWSDQRLEPPTPTPTSDPISVGFMVQLPGGQAVCGSTLAGNFRAGDYPVYVVSTSRTASWPAYELGIAAWNGSHISDDPDALFLSLDDGDESEGLPDFSRL